MRLRDHPLMTYRGIRSWPPVWTWVGGADNTRPEGEVGVLTEAKASRIEPPDRMFLYMEHQNASYIGCLLVDDQTFCRQICALLQNWCGRSIEDIGACDLSYTL